MKQLLKTIFFILIICAAYAVFINFYVGAKFRPVAAPYASQMGGSGRVKFESKVIIHGANKASTARRAIKKYDGFETDIFYDGAYWAAHDAEDIGKTALAQIFAAAQNRADKYVWLDVKKVDAQAPYAAKLKELAGAHGILTENIIIEAAPEAAAAYSRAGFLTAVQVYGLDKYKTPQEISGAVEKFENIARSSGAAALSCHLNNYAYVKAYFPQADKIVYYSSTSNPLSLKRYLIKKQLLKDPKVKFILIDDFTV